MQVFGDQDADGFYYGECNGQRGLVPSNIVAMIEVDDAEAAMQLLSNSCPSIVPDSSVTSSPASSQNSTNLDHQQSMFIGALIKLFTKAVICYQLFYFVSVYSKSYAMHSACIFCMFCLFCVASRPSVPRGRGRVPGRVRFACLARPAQVTDILVCERNKLQGERRTFRAGLTIRGALYQYKAWAPTTPSKSHTMGRLLPPFCVCMAELSNTRRAKSCLLYTSPSPRD